MSLTHRYTHLILTLVQLSTAQSTQAGVATTVSENSEKGITAQHTGKKKPNPELSHPLEPIIIEVAHFLTS